MGNAFISIALACASVIMICITSGVVVLFIQTLHEVLFKEDEKDEDIT